MLEEILQSTPKSNIIGFFLAAPHRAFSKSELTKRLKVSLPTLNSSLKDFDKHNLINSFSQGRSKFYILNQKSNLVKELSASLKKFKNTYSDELGEAIVKLGDVEASFLSGVFTAQPQLPVDILLVGAINLTQLDEFLKSAKKMMGIGLRYSIMSRDEFILRRDTYDRFIKDIFDYPHMTILDRTNEVKTEKPKKKLKKQSRKPKKAKPSQKKSMPSVSKKKKSVTKPKAKKSTPVTKTAVKKKSKATPKKTKATTNRKAKNTARKATAQKKTKPRKLRKTKKPKKNTRAKK